MENTLLFSVSFSYRNEMSCLFTMDTAKGWGTARVREQTGESERERRTNERTNESTNDEIIERNSFNSVSFCC